MANDPSATILVIEDEPAQRAILRYNFEGEGYRVIEADNGEDGVRLAEEQQPDVIVLDWMIPRLSGIEVCRHLRARSQTRLLPVVMLSAKSEELDKIRGLDVGADDYVTKPYSIKELIARVTSQLRRSRATLTHVTLSHGDITLNTETHHAVRGDRTLNLGPTEFRLLATMLERPGRVWTREQLLDRVWGRDVYLETRTVDVHIGRLRKILCRGDEPDPLRTVRGSGYSLS